MITIELKNRDRNGDEQTVATNATGRPPRAANLGAMLDLGNTIYFPHRGRAYGVPPLPWRQGEQLINVWLEAEEYGDQITRETSAPYYRCIALLAKLIWKNTYPTPLWRRIAKALHLSRNVFLDATEREVSDIALFLLERRTSISELASRKTRTHHSRSET